MKRIRWIVLVSGMVLCLGVLCACRTSEVMTTRNQIDAGRLEAVIEAISKLSEKAQLALCQALATRSLVEVQIWQTIYASDIQALQGKTVPLDLMRGTTAAVMPGASATGGTVTSDTDASGTK